MNKIKFKALTSALAVLVAATASTTLQAAFTPPTPAPSALTNTASGAFPLLDGSLLYDSGVIGFSDTINPDPLFTGTIRSAVLRNTSGTLDFYYQLANTSSVASGRIMSRMEVGELGGFTLGSTFTTGAPAAITGLPGFTAGTIAPLTADNTTSFSSGIGFDFSTNGFPTSQLAPGLVSDWLVVRTSATAFNTGALFLNGEVALGGGTTTIANFADIHSGIAQPIPEPTTVVFGFALAGICLSGTVKKLKRNV